jgi:hypothetical protein
VAAFAGQVPADLKCGFCRNPVQGVFYRTLSRFACAKCAGQVSGVVARNTITTDALLMAAAAGLATAIVCAIAWAVITDATHYELGIVASLIGYAVGKAVFAGAGKRRGRALQVLAVVLSLVGVLGGKFGLLGMQISRLLKQHGQEASFGHIATVLMKAMLTAPGDLFNAFDLVWIGIAVYAAWRLLQLPRITIAGPYAYQPAGGGDLQFQTVEPAQTPDAPGAPAASGSK